MEAIHVIGIPIGKRLMRDREPFNMRTPTALHSVNLFMLSLYMTLECAKQAYENFRWKDGVRLWCNPVEKGPGFSDSGYAMARILWIHYLSKAYEFVDTLIMILKKNNRQITFLHVYHHSVYILIIKDCYRPRISPAMLLVQCTIFLLLFANFFRQSYLKPKRETQKKTV
eukprot:jgi/Astpho2/399/Aster-x0922